MTVTNLNMKKMSIKTLSKPLIRSSLRQNIAKVSILKTLIKLKYLDLRDLKIWIKWNMTFNGQKL